MKRLVQEDKPVVLVPEVALETFVQQVTVFHAQLYFRTSTEFIPSQELRRNIYPSPFQYRFNWLRSVNFYVRK
jgi:hypothetical protein